MARKNEQPARMGNQPAAVPQASTGYHTDQITALPSAFTIAEHMEVMASCGTRVGKVEQVVGHSLKLTKNDSQAGGKHHYIPLDWVQRVDRQVHLNKNSEDVMREWTAEAVVMTG
jgi:hypothetical protein